MCIWICHELTDQSINLSYPFFSVKSKSWIDSIFIRRCTGISIMSERSIERCFNAHTVNFSTFNLRSTDVQTRSQMFVQLKTSVLTDQWLADFRNHSESPQWWLFFRHDPIQVIGLVEKNRPQLSHWLWVHRQSNQSRLKMYWSNLNVCVIFTISPTVLNRNWTANLYDHYYRNQFHLHHFQSIRNQIRRDSLLAEFFHRKQNS